MGSSICHLLFTFWEYKRALLQLACQVSATMAKTLVVTQVAGDGDCLFHALAFFDAYDGGALRIDVADFMEAHAQNQVGYEDEWIREAKRLRAREWGGHTAVTAFSLMKRIKVVLHTHRSGEAATAVEEVMHLSISSNEAVRTIHILYNGVDHYDALVEVSDTQDMVPAWPQPPPPIYFSHALNQPDVDFPPLADMRQGHGNRSTKLGKKSLTAPRPADKKSRAKRAAKKKPVASKTSKRDAGAEAPPQEAPGGDPLDDAVPPAAPPCVDEEDEDETNPGLMEALESIPVAETSSHPHRQVEDLIKDPTRQRE